MVVFGVIVVDYEALTAAGVSQPFSRVLTNVKRCCVLCYTALSRVLTDLCDAAKTRSKKLSDGFI